MRSDSPSVSSWPAGSARQYLYVQLGTRRKVGVHVLVCEAFHGPQPSPLHEVAHRDGRSANSATDNLRWALHRENVEDQRGHGTLHAPVYHGGDHPRAKLTPAIVSQLRVRKLVRGEAVTLAKRHGVHPSTILRAARGQNWPDDGGLTFAAVAEERSE